MHSGRYLQASPGNSSSDGLENPLPHDLLDTYTRTDSMAKRPLIWIGRWVPAPNNTQNVPESNVAGTTQGDTLGRCNPKGDHVR